MVRGKGGHGPSKLLQYLNWGACDHASDVRSINHYRYTYVQCHMFCSKGDEKLYISNSIDEATLERI